MFFTCDPHPGRYKDRGQERRDQSQPGDSHTQTRIIMKTFLYFALIATASGGVRLALDEEELKHAKQFQQEALAVERAVQSQINGHYIEPAPLHEGRHLGLGLGFQVGPVGLGVSSGIGKYGVGFNTGAGYGQDYLSYGSPSHYSQYYSPQVIPQSRTVGFGGGVNLGPVGLGASGGIGHGNVGLSAGLGWGQFSNYGSPSHYQQYYSSPYNGPYFPSQFV